MALPKFGTSGRPVFASSGRPAFSCATAPPTPCCEIIDGGGNLFRPTSVRLNISGMFPCCIKGSDGGSFRLVGNGNNFTSFQANLPRSGNACDFRDAFPAGFGQLPSEYRAHFFLDENCQNLDVIDAVTPISNYFASVSRNQPDPADPCRDELIISLSTGIQGAFVTPMFFYRGPWSCNREPLENLNTCLGEEIPDGNPCRCSFQTGACSRGYITQGAAQFTPQDYVPGVNARTTLPPIDFAKVGFSTAFGPEDFE